MSPETGLLKRSVETRLDEALIGGPQAIEQTVAFISNKNVEVESGTGKQFVDVPLEVFNRLARYAELGMQLVLFKVAQANDKENGR